MSRGASRGTVIVLTLMALTALAMLLPAAVGFTLREHEAARAFLYSGLLLGGLTAVTYLANRARAASNRRLAHPFFVMSAAYLLLPPVMALPLLDAVPGLRVLDAWFEMLSAFTTTGASVLAPDVARSVHLWRAVVGWMGGLFVLVYVTAILAPMHLGGFELLRQRNDRQATRHRLDTAVLSPDASGGGTALHRLRQQVTVIAPVYAGVTLLLWMGLSMAGNPPLVALIVAMSALSTSGIIDNSTALPLAGPGELLVALVLLLALSRSFWPGGTLTGRQRLQGRRIELGMAAAVLAGIFLAFALDRFFGLRAMAPPPLLPELWSVLFNAVSFLTTAGFVSQHTDLQSGFFAGPAGIALLGLAMIGGGVATTAGGVKLLRIFALMWQARHEVAHLLYPSSVGGDGPHLRALRRDGAFAAWLFVMVFVFSLAVVMGALTVLGLTLEDALIFAVAALSTTGPLVQVAGSEPLFWTVLGDGEKLVLGFAMMLGRLEFLLLLSVLWPRA